jgi:hypothetical protein
VRGPLPPLDGGEGPLTPFRHRVGPVRGAADAARLGRLVAPHFYPVPSPGDKNRRHSYAVLFVRSLSSLLADLEARVTKVEAKPITSTASAIQGA